GDTNGFDDSNLFTTRLDDQVALNMIHGMTDREIKDAMFSMGDVFYSGSSSTYSIGKAKVAWDVVCLPKDEGGLAGPLYNHVSSRDVFRSGLTLSSHVNDIVRDGVWDWPREQLDKYPILDGCYTHLSNECDRLEWRLHDGTVKHFSVSQVWSSIHPRGEKVPWFDRVSVWDVSNAIGSTCSLSETTPDSHEH
ncbi:hypothetical protein Tco_0107385, partial [Tanacetum coccineum]